MTVEELIAIAREAALKANAPYSQFHVGCAVESVDGAVVTGANMETACYRGGRCAEQSALTGAQHRFGLAKVARVAVAGGGIEDGSLTGERCLARRAAAAARRSWRPPVCRGATSTSSCRTPWAAGSSVIRSGL